MRKEWINKMRYNLMVGYYSARKRGEVLIHGTAWMNLKNIMLCERSQTQKVTYIIPFICSVRNRQIRWAGVGDDRKWVYRVSLRG